MTDKWDTWPYNTYNMSQETLLTALDLGIESISPEAQKRLKWIDWYNQHGKNARLTCRYFGIHHKTFYRWLKRYNPDNLKTLEHKSKRPNKVRPPEIPWQTVDLIVKLRKEYPAWSKYKLEVILKKEYSIDISASTIGRVLKRKGLIEEKVSRKRKKASLNPKPRAKGTKYKYPGSHVEVDTKHIHALGLKIYQFTAIDSVTKQRVIRVYPKATSRQGKLFLKEMVKDFPFRIITIQTDNGSEFLGEFKRACKRLGINHCFAYPKSPEQNALVERSHRTDDEEFYFLGNLGDNLEEQQQLIREWEYLYNHKRPHQSLNYLTPNEYYEKIKRNFRLKWR